MWLALEDMNIIWLQHVVLMVMLNVGLCEHEDYYWSKNFSNNITYVGLMSVDWNCSNIYEHVTLQIVDGNTWIFPKSYSEIVHSLNASSLNYWFHFFKYDLSEFLYVVVFQCVQLINMPVYIRNFFWITINW